MAAESDSQPTPAPAIHERVGPLELLRSAKADGRALLIYSRREPEVEEGETPTERTS